MNNIVKHNNQPIEDIFTDALRLFPFSFERTGHEMGDLFSEIEIEYAEEITFNVGNLFGKPLTAGGWVELNYIADGLDEPSINAMFNIVRDNDWEHGTILGQYQALLGWYDIRTQSWTLEIADY